MTRIKATFARPKLSPEAVADGLDALGLQRAGQAPFWEGYMLTARPDAAVQHYTERHGQPPTHYRVQSSAFFIGRTDA